MSEFGFGGICHGIHYLCSEGKRVRSQLCYVTRNIESLWFCGEMRSAFDCVNLRYRGPLLNGGRWRCVSVSQQMRRCCLMLGLSLHICSVTDFSLHACMRFTSSSQPTSQIHKRNPQIGSGQQDQDHAAQNIIISIKKTRDLHSNYCISRVRKKLKGKNKWVYDL